MQFCSDLTIFTTHIRQFIENFYQNLTEGSFQLSKYFTEEASMDHIFTDPIHNRCVNKLLIVDKLSDIYKSGLNTTIRKVICQKTTILTNIIVTVTGLFKYNGVSWPFMHVFYLISDINSKFYISNAILYDCVNPKQFLGENFSFSTIINHQPPSISPQSSLNNNLTPDSISEYLSQININHLDSQPSSNSATTTNNIATPTTNNTITTSTINNTTTTNTNKTTTTSTNKTTTSNTSKTTTTTNKPISITVKTISENKSFSKVYNKNSTYVTNNHVQNNSNENCSDDNCDQHSNDIYSNRNNNYYDDDDLLIESSIEYSLDSNTLFVGNFPENITEDDINRIFIKYGTIQAIKYISAKKIAFITYKLSSSVLHALKDCDIRIGDRQLRVQQRKIINTVKHVPRENLELYGYSKDNRNSKLSKHKKN